MKPVFVHLLLCLFIVHTACLAQHKLPYKFSSPDNKTVAEIGPDEDGKLKYRLFYAGTPVTGSSALGLVLNNGTAGEHTEIKSLVRSRINETFAWPLGEDDHIQNRYTAATLACQSGPLRFNLLVRLYDGSLAFRYELPGDPTTQKSVSKELTEFNMEGPYTLYQYNEESVFTPVSIDTFSSTCDLPATLTNNRFFISIGEADNKDFTKEELRKGAVDHGLMLDFRKDSVVAVTGTYQTPWRTISVATSAVGLHAFSQLFLKLAGPAVRQVPAWIKPGKLIRSQLNTKSAFDCIDFAAAHGLQYIMFDAGWYGAEFRSTSDPTQVIPQIDMPAIIARGKQKGIGVILYVNYVGLRAKLDTIIPLYKKWGVKGLKFGFVDGLSQGGLTWLYQAIRKVNDAGFILDIHDNYKPTGISRIFPALLTQEGIRGDENSPDAFHTTTLPFTRFLAGPADFTFCYPNATNTYSKNLKVSMGQQLALTVIYFSPLQSMFWYGQPLDYTNAQEIEFFSLVPTVWNETHYLAGDIGKSVSVARRQGSTWFIGNAAGLQDWSGTISLSFLQPGKTYTASVYEDDGHNSIRKRTLSVKKGDRFAINLKAATGQALMIR